MTSQPRSMLIEQKSGPRLAVVVRKPSGQGPFPTIIMGHGLGAVKEDGLYSFADEFVKVGYAVINFDYSTWGESEGLPRHVIIVWNEYRDFASVVEWARAQPADFDPDRLVVWGSSFGGMHTTRLLAEDQNLRAGIAQCPCVDAQAASLMKPVTISLRLGFWAVLDVLGSYLGCEPIYLENAKREPAAPGVALMMGEDIAAKWDMIIAKPTRDLEVDNRVAARSILSFPVSRPVLKASRINVPYLIIAPEWDSVAPLELAQKTAQLARQGELVVVPGGHFDLYHGGIGYEKNLRSQLEFLARVCPV